MDILAIILLVVLTVFVILSFLNLVPQKWINVLVLLLFLLVFFGDKIRAQPPLPSAQQKADSIQRVQSELIRTKFTANVATIDSTMDYIKSNITAKDFEKNANAFNFFIESLYRKWLEMYQRKK